MSKVNKQQRNNILNFLKKIRNGQGFMLYLGTVQVYFTGMLDAGLKNRPIESLVLVNENQVGDECARNLLNYIRDVYEGNPRTLSLKDCLSEKKNKQVK